MNTISVNNQAIANSTPIVYSMAELIIPCTVTLKSKAAGRKVELSTDGGTEYFSPQADAQSSTMLVVTVRAPVTHVRVTGESGDFWSLQ